MRKVHAMRASHEEGTEKVLAELEKPVLSKGQRWSISSMHMCLASLSNLKKNKWTRDGRNVHAIRTTCEHHTHIYSEKRTNGQLQIMGSRCNLTIVTMQLGRHKNNNWTLAG